MMKASTIHFEMAERGRALNYGGIGAIHLMGQRLGLAEEIDSRLQLLKRHLPYHESDHVLNLAYNALLDGQRLEDIELRRNDEAFLDGLGAQRIPDPTTSGDFTRRFDEDSVLELNLKLSSWLSPCQKRLGNPLSGWLVVKLRPSHGASPSVSRTPLCASRATRIKSWWARA
jgi:hypothetical protein